MQRQKYIDLNYLQYTHIFAYCVKSDCQRARLPEGLLNALIFSPVLVSDQFQKNVFCLS